MKIENRDPRGAGAPSPIHNSGSMRPTPNVGAHIDPRAGGIVSQDQYRQPMSPHNLPIKNGGNS